MSYTTELGKDTFGNIIRINNVLADMPINLESVPHLENLNQQVKNAKIELQKPFLFEQELTVKSERFSFLDAELNVEGGNQEQAGGKTEAIT